MPSSTQLVAVRMQGRTRLLKGLPGVGHWPTFSCWNSSDPLGGACCVQLLPPFSRPSLRASCSRNTRAQGASRIYVRIQMKQKFGFTPSSFLVHAESTLCGNAPSFVQNPRKLSAFEVSGTPCEFYWSTWWMEKIHYMYTINSTNIHQNTGGVCLTARISPSTTTMPHEAKVSIF